jgi:tetratricopeptide (TPR) repeat protein
MQNALGVALQLDGQLEAAIFHFHQAVKNKPDFVDAYFNLGNLLRKRKSSQAATLCFQKIIDISSNNSDAWFSLGDTLFQIEEYHRSLECFNRCLAINPGEVKASIKICQLMVEFGHVEKAVTEYQNLLIDHPNEAEIYFQLGQTQEYQGDTLKAVENFLKAFQYNSHHPGVIFALASLPQEVLTDTELQDLKKSYIKISPKLKMHTRLFIEAHILRHFGKLDDSWNRYMRANHAIYSQRHEKAENTSEFQKKLLLKRRSQLPPKSVQDATQPISLFVLGPSRSGKTTIERILGTSPLVARGYENPPFLSLLHSYSINGKPAERLSDLSPEAKRDFLTRYRAHIEHVCKDRGIFTDTSPDRMLDAWDIADLVPNSFFIFVKREPIDTAVGIFQQHYHSGIHYAYHPTTIRDHLSWYRDMQEILSKKLGDRAIIIHYEDLLNNPLSEVSRLETLLGMPLNYKIPEEFLLKRNIAPNPFRKHFEQYYP